MTISFSNVHKGLRRKRERTQVFSGATATFSSDKISGVLFPPDSGKTTLISLATGKLKPDAGHIRVSSSISFPIAGGSVFNRLLTPRENIAFLCRVAGFDPKPIIRFIREFTEIGDAFDKQMSALNRDERTKILFTTAYAIPYDMYLADESLIGGRGSFRAKCTDLVLERMSDSGFLIATSSATVLKKYCNAFFIMSNQVITEFETADEAVDAIGLDRLRDGDGGVDIAEGTDGDAL